MNARKCLIWLWPFAVLPTMIMTWAVYFFVIATVQNHSFSSSFLRFLNGYPKALFVAVPYYTVPCLILLGWACLRWLRQPNGRTFFWTLFVGWGMLGMPGAFVFVMINGVLALSGMAR